MRSHYTEVELARTLEYAGCTEEALEEIAHRRCSSCGQPSVHSVRYFDRPRCSPTVARVCNGACHVQALKRAKDTQYILEVWDRNARMTDQERREAYDEDRWDREVCRERH